MILEKKYNEFREKVRYFAVNEVAKRAKEIDEKGEVPYDLIRRLAELQLLGIPFPREYGGAGLDTLSYAIAIEEISRFCGSTGLFLAAHTSLGCLPIYLAGNEEQKKKWLIPLAMGEKIGAFGLTEPNAGSDAGATQTRYKLVGDYYIISGSKRFITSGSIADIITFTATYDPKLGYRAISSFVVEKGTKGFSPGRDEDKLGVRGTITSELIFDECQIPKENLLGKEGEGFKLFMKTLDSGRISIGACALGLAQGVLEVCIEYVKERELKNMQYIQGKIADMATQIEAARLLVYEAAILKDKGLSHTKEAAMAKLFASETGVWVTSEAVKLLGLEGLTRNYLVERHMRDAKLMEIGEGTSEIQRIVIARNILWR